MESHGGSRVFTYARRARMDRSFLIRVMTRLNMDRYDYYRVLCKIDRHWEICTALTVADATETRLGSIGEDVSGFAAVNAPTNVQFA